MRSDNNRPERCIRHGILSVSMQRWAAGLLIACGSTARATDESASFFDVETVQEVHLEVTEADLRTLHDALPRRIYVPATFRWNDTVVKNVGIRYKGNSSSHPRSPFRRSFLIKFNEYEKGQLFLGLRRVALDNGIQFGSVFSEPLVTEILRDLEIPACRCNFARLFLNGKFHGVYVNVERIDKSFLQRQFADASGPLYKNDVGGAGGNLVPVPREVPSDKLAFEPKTRAAKRGAPDVLNLIEKLVHCPPAEFADTFDETMSSTAFLKTMAVMLYAGAFDQLTGWNPHNYYLYQTPNDGRWHYLPWDLDVGFADKAFGRVPVIGQWNAAWPIPGGPPRPVIERIVDDPRLLTRYREHADVILERYFHPDRIIPRLDALYALVKEDLERDPFPHRRITNPRDRGYEDIVESLRSFMRLRYKTARAQLDAPGERPKIVRRRQRAPKPGPASDDAPSELRAMVAKDRVTLEWKDNAEGEAGHVLQRASGELGKFQNYMGFPGRNSVRAVDRRVMPGKTYRYRVFAVHESPDGQRGSGVSEEITVVIPRDE